MKKIKLSKKIKSAARMALIILCGAVLGINAYLINANSLVGNRLPMPFGYGAAVVLSGSMEPEFSKGDLIIVKEAESFGIGDIVVFEDGASLVVHRIIRMEGDAVVTKGDANNAEDKPTAASDIKGTVLFAIPFAGTAVEFLKTPVGIFCTIGAAILLIEIPHRREVKKDDEDMQKIIDEINRLKEEQNG